MLSVVIVIITLIIFFVLWRFVFFFRNPKRKIEIDENLILSPADGYVVYIKKVEPGRKIFSIKKTNKILLNDLMFIDDVSLLDKPGWLIGVCMTPLDVHYNRAPIEGVIRKIRHDFPANSRINLDMFPALQNLFFNLKPFYSGCEYIIRNERASYIIKNKNLSVYVTQIADNWIKKIVTYKEQEDIQQGEIFGLIKMGSQVDLFIPDEENKIEIITKERKRVKAGLSVIAAIKECN